MPQVSNVQTEKRKGPFHTTIISTFTYGFDHVLEYERRDAVTRLIITIRLDGEEVYRKDAGLFQTIGNESVPFTIEGARVGLIKVTLATVAVWFRITVDGTTVMTA